MAKRQMGKRIYREPTAEQAAKYRTIRDLIAAEMPEIRAEAKRLRSAEKLSEIAELLKRERESQGLSLADVESKTGITKSAISRLESGDNGNPTISTLERYADALGKQLAIVLLDK